MPLYFNDLRAFVAGFAARAFISLVLLTGAVDVLASSGSVALLQFELHDLTLNPDVAGEAERVATLQPLLKQNLIENHQQNIVDNPPSAASEAAKGAGYIFDRPKVAARIGKEVGADWVVTGRLHKASFLFVYLRAQLIDVATGAVSADFVVEIKGTHKKLTGKGVETLAEQINQALISLNTSMAQSD